jgi:UDP-N-acetylglucosamine 2-epimerase (non-hydrolysing)
MKILTVLSTRPEIIRLSSTISKLNETKGIEHKIVYTNQNFDRNLSTIFFDEFDFKPDYVIESTFSTLTAQIANIGVELQNIIDIEQPDKILILGDTNGAMITAIVAKRNSIPIYHVEAGNRCWNDKVPEEMNRKIIDSIADYHLCYTEFARRNLTQEGKSLQTIFKIGNPIYEIYHNCKIPSFEDLSIKKTSFTKYNKRIINSFKYNYVTLHRSELTPYLLQTVLNTFGEIFEKEQIPFIIVQHPRIKSMLESCEIPYGIIFIQPVNFSTSQGLIKYSNKILTDSGTLPEEAYLHTKKSILLRNETERPELLESGNMILTGYNPESIKNVYNSISDDVSLNTVQDYCVNSSNRIIGILMSDL